MDSDGGFCQYVNAAIGAQVYNRTGNQKIAASQGGGNGSTRHMALSVAYVSCGGNTSQYVVVDPYHSTAFPSKLSDFFATYSATKKIGTFND